jgi:E3 ubiquitin-protein ligase UHRF1
MKYYFEFQKFGKTNLTLARSCNTQLDMENGAEAENWRPGKRIRVLRSWKLKKHSRFAPNEGYRYDGIYRVVKYW